MGNWLAYLILMLAVFAVPAFAFGCPDGWNYSLAIDVTTGSATQLNFFPALVAINTSNSTLWNTTTCTNVRFFNAANLTELPYDLDDTAYCGNSTVNSNFWVGGNYSSSATRIFACLGGGMGTSYENETGLWRAANYTGVFHMSEGNATTLQDSANYNNLTRYGSYVMNWTDGGGMTVGTALKFANTGNYTKATPVGLATGAGASTETARVFVNGTAWCVAYGFGNPVAQVNDRGTYLVGAGGQAGKAGYVAQGVYVPQQVQVLSKWYQVSTSYNGSTQWFYMNQTSTNAVLALNTGTTLMAVGGIWGTSVYGGLMDEMRFANGSRSSDWIIAEYNQTASVGAIEINAPPVIASSGIDPTVAYANSTLMGYCNATDVNGYPVRYYWRWFVNNVVNETGVTGYLAQGIERNVANISVPNLTKGQNWTLECMANNAALNSSALNSTNRTISNSMPLTGVPTLSPIPAYIIDTVACTNSTTNDTDGDAITFKYRWFINTTVTAVTAQTIDNATFGTTDNLICEIMANDGTSDSLSYNSSSLTVMSGAPILAPIVLPGIIYTQNCINATVVFYYTLLAPTGEWGNNTITLVQGGTIAAAVKHNATQNAQENFTLVLTQGNYTYGMNFTATNGSASASGLSTPVSMGFTVTDSAAACMAYLINGTGTNVTVNLSEIMENATFRRAIAQDVWRYEQRYKEAYAGANEGLRWQDYALAVGIAILILFAVVEFIRHQRGPRGHFG